MNFQLKFTLKEQMSLSQQKWLENNFSKGEICILFEIVGALEIPIPCKVLSLNLNPPFNLVLKPLVEYPKKLGRIVDYVNDKILYLSFRSIESLNKHVITTKYTSHLITNVQEYISAASPHMSDSDTNLLDLTRSLSENSFFNNLEQKICTVKNCRNSEFGHLMNYFHG